MATQKRTSPITREFVKTYIEVCQMTRDEAKNMAFAIYHNGHTAESLALAVLNMYLEKAQSAAEELIEVLAEQDLAADLDALKDVKSGRDFQAHVAQENQQKAQQRQALAESTQVTAVPEFVDIFPGSRTEEQVAQDALINSLLSADEDPDDFIY